MAKYHTISLDATSSTNLTGTGNYNQNHTIGDSPKRLLLFAHLARNSVNNPSSVTFQGLSLTKKITSSVNGVTIWYLKNPPVGAGTIAVNGTFSTRDIGVVVSLFNAEVIDDPFDFTDDQFANGSPLTGSFTVTIAGTFVFGGMAGESSVQGSAGSSQTVILQTSEGDSRAGWYKANYSAGAGSMVWNGLTGGNTMVNVGIKPALRRGGVGIFFMEDL